MEIPTFEPRSGNLNLTQDHSEEYHSNVMGIARHVDKMYVKFSYSRSRNVAMRLL